MGHKIGTERSQSLLLPERVEDYVGENNPVRFIDAFVDGLDLDAVGFTRVKAKATGRPGYDPADMLKLYIYGYLNRVRSSRRLEAETHRNLEVIWLMRQLKPDFKTIADFRKANRTAFREVFRQFVRLCRDLDLYGRELLAVDGTRIKAVNNREKNFTTASLKRDLARLDERLEKYLSDLNDADKKDEPSSGGDGSASLLAEKIEAMKTRRDRLRGYQKTLEETGETQISLTDPDARAMHSGTRVGVGYNAQIAVDAKSHLIVEQTVCNHVSDHGHLAQTAGAAKDALGVEEIRVLADGGYYQIDDLAACEDAGITPYVPAPKPRRYKDGERFGKANFIYDVEKDAYLCPNGSYLTRVARGEDNGKAYTQYAKRSACSACPIRAQCTATKSYRRIHRYDNEAVLVRAKARVAAWPEAMSIRRSTVELPFGSIKQWMGQGAFLMKRLDNVRGEFSLTALAYNIRRAITLVGIPALIEAARA